MRQIAVLLLSAGSAFAVDPQLMNLVMPDAKVLAGLNAVSAESSPLGQFIVSKAGAGPQKFAAATGFNPLQNVSEILAAGVGNPAAPGGLVLAKGTFPVDQFVAALAGNANAQISTYGGATLIAMNAADGKAPNGVAFIGTTIAVAGDLANVKAAIDRSGAVNSIDPALAVKVNQLSGSEDGWFVSSLPVASLLPANSSAGAGGVGAMVLPMLKNIVSFDGGVKLGASAALTAELVANSPQNAAAIDALVKLVAGLAGSANTANNAQGAQMTQLLQSLQTTVNGSAVELSLAIPEAQIEAVLNSVSPADRSASGPAGQSRERAGDPGRPKRPRQQDPANPIP